MLHQNILIETEVLGKAPAPQLLIRDYELSILQAMFNVFMAQALVAVLIKGRVCLIANGKNSDLIRMYKQ